MFNFRFQLSLCFLTDLISLTARLHPHNLCVSDLAYHLPDLPTRSRLPSISSFHFANHIFLTMETADDGNTHAEDSPSETQEAGLAIWHPNRSGEPPDLVIDREIIDDDGDVLAQTKSKQMLVSSKILALASPVFKAMFSSNFLEGSTPRSVQNPLKLPLPDDDPDALAVLFHTLHFSSKRTFSNLSADLQLHVAQLADKYQCTASIAGESGRWLRSLSEGTYESSVLWTLSTIAFLMGHKDDFSKFTVKLVLGSTTAELDLAAPNAALPETIKGMS